jgi:hypothetical protein
MRPAVQYQPCSNGAGRNQPDSIIPPAKSGRALLDGRGILQGTRTSKMTGSARAVRTVCAFCFIIPVYSYLFSTPQNWLIARGFHRHQRDASEAEVEESGCAPTHCPISEAKATDL